MQPGQRRMKLTSCPKNGMKNFWNDMVEKFPPSGFCQKPCKSFMRLLRYTRREIHVAESQQAAALGAAIIGAIAAGTQNGGYDNFKEAIKKMA